MPKRIPLKKWAADKYNALPHTGDSPREYALSIMRYATAPYRRKRGADPFNDTQRKQLTGWDYERLNRHAAACKHTTPQIVAAYHDLLAEWYGEKETR